MKTFFCTVLVFFECLTCTYAQRNYELLLNSQLFLSSNITSFDNSYALNTIDLIDMPVASYVGGAISFQIRRPLSKLLRVQTGIGYQQSGLVNQRIYLDLDVNPNKYVAKVDHKDILIPLQFSYSFNDKKIRGYALFGVNTVITLDRTVFITRFYRDNSKIKEAADYDHSIFRKMNFAVVTGIGYEWNLSKKVNIQIQPTITCNIWNSSLNVPFSSINWRLFQIGITLGLVIK